MPIDTDHIATQHLVFGMVLFLLGLVNGVFVQTFTNPRMGLTAHLAGVQNGMVLLIVGLIWNRLALPPVWLNVIYGLNVFSMYAIWAALLLAGIWGTSRVTPIAGAGFTASPAKENTVLVMIGAGSVAALVAAFFMTVGLVRGA